MCATLKMEPHVYISTFTLLALKANLKYQVTRPFTICSSGKSYDQAGLAKFLYVWWCYIGTNHGCTQNIIMLVLVAQPQYQYTFIGEQDICLLGSDLRSQ